MAEIVLVDGREATAADLAAPALGNYGHYTTMQVRDGAVRGLARHVARLRMQHTELFGADLDVDRVRGLLREAVATRPDASVRVILHQADDVFRVLISLNPPAAPAAGPMDLMPVDYARPMAHIKHVGTFAQTYYRNLAGARGYHDALLIDPAGEVTETSVANIGFLDGTSIVWPSAPVLHGTTWQLLDDALPGVGFTATRAAVTLESAGNYIGAFLANSTGIVPVRRIGGHVYGDTADLVKELDLYYQSTPWDQI